MSAKPNWWACAALLFCVPLATAEDKDGFVSIFNGKDLSGWHNVNCHPSTFFVKDGKIITTGKPTGFLRSLKHYENFILEMEWMHINKEEVGNSGLFIWGDPLPAIGSPYTRGIEVQVLVNLEKENAYTSHGDIFSIWGATCVPDRPHPMGWARCLPSERRCKGGGEWNHYRVEAINGSVKLHVNGKEVSGVTKSSPRKGYIALESEGAECHFRNIRIKELPSTQPKATEIAELAKDHLLMFNGLDMTGWEFSKEHAKQWSYGGGNLRTKATDRPIPLTFETPLANGELQFDFRYPEAGKKTDFQISYGYGPPMGTLTVSPDGNMSANTNPPQTLQGKMGANWNRLKLVRKDQSVVVLLNNTSAGTIKDWRQLSKEGKLSISSKGAIQIMNMYATPE
ncbi:MAG: DUF1080 domain-containing protein [Zavarzinella sp.]